jgi:hypothetical protein
VHEVKPENLLLLDQPEEVGAVLLYNCVLKSSPRPLEDFAKLIMDVIVQL